MKLPKVARAQVKPFSAAKVKRLSKACDEFRGDGRFAVCMLRSSMEKSGCHQAG